MAKLYKVFNNLIHEFDIKNISYAVIGNYNMLPYHTDNDIDIWVNDYKRAFLILTSVTNDHNLKLYMHNETANGSNNYFFYEENGNLEIIKIDLMTETAWKSLFPIVNSEIIARNRKKFKDFYIVNEDLEGCMHLLYPLITYGIIKEKYKDKLNLLSNSKTFKILLNSLLGKTLSSKLIYFLNNKDFKKVKSLRGKCRRRIIFNFLGRFDLKGIIKLLRFIYSIIFRMYHKNGLIIAFTGIDGAGKTTIMKNLLNRSNYFFSNKKSKQFYWRPFLLPRISSIFGGNGQRELYDNSGKRVVSDSILSNMFSFIKYIYYSIDFIIGKLKYILSTHTGGLVMFDRYHLDNVIYPERFGFRVNKKIMRFFDKFIIPKPDLIFFFNARAEVLHDRKFELNISEIKKQQFDYVNEINLRSNIITINTEKTPVSSINQVLSFCLNFMYERNIK